MDFAGWVDKLAAADRAARDLAGEARRKEENFQAGLARETAALRESCLARARRRVEQIEQEQLQMSRQEAARREQAQAGALARLEAAYARQGAQWVDKLFSLIVEAQP